MTQDRYEQLVRAYEQERARLDELIRKTKELTEDHEGRRA